MKKMIVTLLLLSLLWGCGARNKETNLEKDGSLYQYGDFLSFYYPKKWIISKDEIKLAVSIKDGSSTMALYFDAYSFIEGNPEEQLLEFYIDDLKEHSIEIFSANQVELSNGYTGYAIEGRNTIKDTYFYEVVSYLNNKQYIYSFVAEKEDYDNNLKNMKLYMYSLNIEDFINE